MTNEQQHIEHIKERMKGIATRGIGQTLLGIQDELNLLDRLLDAGIGASIAEVHAACNSFDVFVSDPTGDLARERKFRNEHLSEQLAAMQGTVGVVICCLAAVRNNADACNDAFKKCHETDIEPALIDALIHQPEYLDNEAAEIAMQQGDSSAMATLRRQLGNLLQEEGQVDG